MSFSKKNRIFQKIATAIFILYALVMVFAVVKAYSRTSGSTGIDAGQILKMRLNADFKE